LSSQPKAGEARRQTTKQAKAKKQKQKQEQDRHKKKEHNISNQQDMNPYSSSLQLHDSSPYTLPGRDE